MDGLINQIGSPLCATIIVLSIQLNIKSAAWVSLPSLPPSETIKELVNESLGSSTSGDRLLNTAVGISSGFPAPVAPHLAMDVPLVCGLGRFARGGHAWLL